MLGKYAKLLLGAYLVERMKAGKYFETREHKQGKEGLLHKYGKLMLATYAVKKLQSRKPHEETEQFHQCMEPPVYGSSTLPHAAKKFGKWFLSLYLIKKFHHREPVAEKTEVIETEKYKEDKRSSMIKLDTILVGALAGATVLYAVKKYRSKHSGHKVNIE